VHRTSRDMLLDDMTNRRDAILSMLGATALWADDGRQTRQATGLKIGEITPDSATIWTRRTRSARRVEPGIRRRGHSPKAYAPKPEENIATFEGACPSDTGYARLTVEPDGGRGRKQVTDWVELDPSRDSVHQFRLQGLTPGARYRAVVETRESRNQRADEPLEGKFRTAPAAGEAATVRFALSSCQMYCRMDREDGFSIYESIGKWQPDFLVSCGDNVYYDSEDPVAASLEAARYHWQRMYSLPTLRECLRVVPGYWQKDDHDLLSDDCWPGIQPAKMGSLTFEQGKRTFREQTPAPAGSSPMYRRFRWGAALELWLPESRDYRSANNIPDNAEKTIWGAEQKRWLMDTLKQSTAAWKIVVNPNPVIGPDHKRKNDNHANPAFAIEGRQFRAWLKDHVSGSVILMNGDRHWQYHSVDPESGVHEYGCGPASDEHAISPSGGEDKNYHRFLRIKGGFAAVSVNPADREHPLVIEHRDVRGNTVYRQSYRRQ